MDNWKIFAEWRSQWRKLSWLSWEENWRQTRVVLVAIVGMSLLIYSVDLVTHLTLSWVISGIKWIMG